MRYVLFATGLLLVGAAAAFFYIRQNDGELVCFVGRNAPLFDLKYNAVTGSLRYDETDIPEPEFANGAIRFRYSAYKYMTVELETQELWVAREGKTKDSASVLDRGACAATRAAAAEKQAAYEKANAMTEHAFCKDEASATDYAAAFSGAVQAGFARLDPSRVAELQADLARMTEGLKEGDYGALCAKMDALRQKYGF